ncbi:hypothetical protein PM082_023149 [Marasmius tenuissimus]|nr:hypothetical protein PM082_023149 [Marasmius tenuissimus]
MERRSNRPLTTIFLIAIWVELVSDFFPLQSLSENDQSRAQALHTLATIGIHLHNSQEFRPITAGAWVVDWDVGFWKEESF